MTNEELNSFLNIIALVMVIITILFFCFAAYMAYKQIKKELKRKGYMVVPIEKLKNYKEYFNKVNNHELEKIIFTENDEDIIIDTKIISDFKYTGLNTTDIIFTEFYKHGFTEDIKE